MVVLMRRRDVQQQLALRATFARAGASVMVAWAVAGDALGQTPGQQPPVQQVDTAAGDRHALSTSLRVMSVDLSPHNFGNLLRAASDKRGIAAFDHDAQHGLSTRSAQQNAALIGELALCGPLGLSNAWLVAPWIGLWHTHIDQALRIKCQFADKVVQIKAGVA